MPGLSCAVTDCDAPRATRGWCQAHYMRWRRHGSVTSSIPVRRLIRGDDHRRFWVKVDKQPGEDGCWLWTSAKNHAGYGVFQLRTQTARAHRWIYEQEVGSIPEGLQLDHLCRTRSCVRPSHLEPVTARENTMRGEGPSARNAQKTHCFRGHLLAGNNLIIKSKQRDCRTCARQRQRDSRRKAVRDPR